MSQQPPTSPTTALDKFVQELRSPRLRADFDLMKADLPLTPEHIAELDKYFEFKLQSLVESFQDLCPDGDETELVRLLPHAWIEYRMEWTRYNAQMQYQTILKGQAETLLMARGGALSQIIAIIERQLSTRDVYWVTRLASDPVNVLDGRSEISRRLLEIADAAGSGGHEIIESFFQLREDIGSHVKSPDVKELIDKRIDKVISRAEGVLQKSLTLNLSDLSACLELTVVRLLENSPFLLVVSCECDDPDLRVPNEAAGILNKLFEDWVQEIIGHSLEGSMEERVKAGKLEHLTFRWNIKKISEARFVFELNDDGIGKVRADTMTFQRPGWQLEVSNSEGQGSKLVVSYPVNNVHQLFLLSVVKAGSPVIFAVSTDVVLRIAKPESFRDLPDGRQMAMVAGGNALPIIPLESALWDGPSPELPSYLHVKAGGSEFILSVTNVVGTTRSSIRPPPFRTADGAFEGYAFSNGRVVPVLDVVRIKELFDGKWQNGLSDAA